MDKNTKLTSIQIEKKEQFVKIARTLIITRDLEKGSELDVFHLALIKSMARNYSGYAYTGVLHLMQSIDMSTQQNTSKIRTKESLLRLQENGHILIFENMNSQDMVTDLKHAKNYFIKPTDKDEEQGFAKVFESDLQKIVMMKNNYKPKVFLTYLNILGFVYFTISNVSLGYKKIDNIVLDTGMNRKAIINFLQAMVEAEVIYSVYLKPSDSVVKNYYTRWIHKDHAASWAVDQAETTYKKDINMFKGGGKGVSDEVSI